MRLTIPLLRLGRSLSYASLLWLLGPSAYAEPPRLYPPSVTERSPASYEATGTRGMIASSHPIATAAGLAMLKAGGNAMDAAVAISFAISVVRPQSTGIGGGGFMLWHDAIAKKIKVYDFRERAPLAATEAMYLDKKGQPIDVSYGGHTISDASVNGHLAVGTPGLVAGLVKAHKEHGVLPLATVMAPAIAAARDGFPVYEDLARAITERKNVLEAYEGTHQIFFKNQAPLKAGDLLVQKDLAWTLEQIAAKGAAGFYRGPVAERILKEIARGKGILTQKDLDQYRVIMRQPVEGDYRGYRIVSMPPPSSGGVHIVQILNILEGFPMGQWGFNDPRGVQKMVEAMRLAYADRAAYLGDPDFVAVPTKGLIAKGYAAALRKKIPDQRAVPSAEVKAGQPGSYESPSTTHLSVVDRAGNAVSSTQTINYTFGSGVVAEGTGVVLNDEMDDFSKKPGVPNAYGLVGSQANAIAAKKTMLSSMSPTLVFDKDRRLKMVVGSPGGSRIITATLQTIQNVIDYQMNLADAVQATRIHQQWLPDKVYYEKGRFTPEALQLYTKMGYQMEETKAIGDVQAIIRTPEGWQGVSDTRSTGQAVGY